MDTSNPTKVRLLLVEDSASDAELLVMALTHDGFQIEHERVESEADLREALERGPWDILVADYSLPHFDGLSSVALARAYDPALPCVLVSGVVSEERAIAAMRTGVRDYLSKDSLARLPAVLEREVAWVRGRRHAEGRLRAARDHARAIVDGIHIPLATLDRALRVVYINPAFQRTFCCGQPPPAGNPLLPVLGLREEGDELATRLLALARSGTELSDLEVEIGQRDGVARTYMINAQQIGSRDGDEPGLLLLALRDITERKVTARQLEVAQRMEAIGRIAGGVAHDFNNVLTVIHSYAAFLSDALGDDETAKADVQMIRDAACRAAQLTNQLLAFSRRQVQSLEVFDLNRVLVNLERMLSRVIGEDIDLQTLLSSDLSPIRADVAQIEQIVMNLLINARDAMPHGGRISIETRAVDRNRAHVDAQGTIFSPGRYVLLRVTDSGEGMTAATCARIFEPFFTTKKGGTGLGLSTVYGIVRQSSGYILVESRVGEGTTFDVMLPAITDQREVASVHTASLRPTEGTEAIMLVEDEDGVRLAASRILGRQGYFVVQAASPDEALAQWGEYGPRCQLLLTDLVMPGMNGRELAKRLREGHPELRVVFMSGYANEEPAQASRGTSYLKKPFTPETLLKEVRRALDRG